MLLAENGDICPRGGDYTRACGLDIPSFFKRGATYQFIPLLGSGPFNERMLEDAERWGMPVAYCEDSFLRSATVFWDKASPALKRQSVSLSCDAHGLYFDSTRPSDIERMIGERSATAEELAAAHRLMKRIVDSRLSKYNNQPIEVPPVPGSPSREKILVIDQDKGDASIRLGGATDEMFKEMVEAAADENPNADILIKTHPDSLVAGGRVGNLSSVQESDRVHKITFPVNPYSILERVSKVYIATSTFGFEALMAGKPVCVFGMPWYAGWGVSNDRQKCARRTRRATLEELFHAFYVRYTKYADPETHKPCSIDEAIDALLRLRFF